MIIPIEKKKVNFSGADLMAIKANNEKIYVGVSWVCKGIGFNKSQKDRQVQNIQADLVLNKGCVKFEAGVFDANNEMLAIELNYLPLWLAKISITPNMRKETPWLADRLIQFQLEAKEVLASAFLSKQPASQLEVLQSAINQLVAQEQQVKEIKEQQALIQQENETLKKRMDTFDNVDAIGNLQKRLNEMVKKYARQEGVSFQSGWRLFKIAYNKAYSTNLTTKMNNYKEKHGLKTLTKPQYFSLTGTLEDAIRVVDKMFTRAAG